MALATVTLTWLIVVLRLWSIQVVNGDQYAEQVRRQSTGEMPLYAQRGVIYDRAGREVAVNVIRRSLFVFSRTKKEVAAAEKYLDKLMGKRRGYTRREYAIQPGKFKWIKRGIDDALAQKIKSGAPAGVHIREERGREYPYGLTGKQILGYTDRDNKGISGIEALFDEPLRGRDGRADYQRDGLSNTYKVNERPLVKPISGKSIVLTVDWEFQEIVDDELRRGVAEYNAKSASAVFVDCNTGEVLAAAHFDPTEEDPERPAKLRPITDSFEPGSIYKVITAAALLDAHLARPDTLVYCEEGLWQMGRQRLRDDKELDTISFHNVIAKSSNIGTGKLALLLGGEKLVEASRRFGIGQKTRIDFPGEQSGSIHDDLLWSDYNIAALSIGHSVAVTPLQMAMMMASIANGGKLLRPRFLRGVVNEGGVVSDNREPEVICRVAGESALEQLRDMLESVVDSGGTAPQCVSDIISIAGKTGTAEVPRPDGRGYFKNKFIASFAAYFPADTPQIAGIVLMEQPEPIHYGGWTSGPTLKAIAERFALAHPERFGPPEHRILASLQKNPISRETPRFVGLTHTKALDKANETKVTLRGDFTHGDVVWQFPEEGSPLGPDGVVAIQLSRLENPDASQKDNPVRSIIPDLEGLTIQQATLLLARKHLRFKLEGVGRIVHQEPSPGGIISDGSALVLKGMKQPSVN
ncbi:MAG: penicillin-binding transpeptidase domain-containing protein [Candidatus Zixiibacteriota bacterium]